MALLNGLMEADVSPIHISRRRPIKDQSHQQPSFGDYFYAMTMSSNHSKRRDKYEQYLADEDEFDLHERAKRRRILIGYASAIATIATTSVLSTSGKALSIHRGRVPGAKTIKRERLDVAQSCHDMNDRHFRRRYRMDKESFWILLDIIEPHLPSTGESRVRGSICSIPNGPITHTARLSMALRIAAGGDPLDIAVNHGVSDAEPTESFWLVVDAVHKSFQLDINFPTSHEAQYELAQEFRSKSTIGITNCVGAIDGILMWIHKPTDQDCDVLGFRQTKFFCGRKKKFGLNMQAVCDARRRFLWVELRYPGSTSDFFAFDQSSLKCQLERAGFLREGLCLFGDAAYANSSYMCVPFRSATGTHDHFNFFQSQLRINIECAFGMLVHRFGMLRKAWPVNVSIAKTNSAILALCKLHNFCIESNSGNDISTADVGDSSHIMMDGGMLLPRIDRVDGNEDTVRWMYDDTEDRLNALLDGGDHRDDHADADRRRFRRHREVTPRHWIHNYIAENGFRRPPIRDMR